LKKILVVGGDASVATPILSEARQRGFHITATSRNSSIKHDEDISWLTLDLANEQSISKFFLSMHKVEFDLIFFLIGSTSLDSNDLGRYLEIHFKSVILTLIRLMTLLREESDSILMFLSSRSALHPSRDVFYGAVKAGINSAVRSMTIMAPSNQKLVVVAPGLVRGTTMYEAMPSVIRDGHEERSGHSLLDGPHLAREIFLLLEDWKALTSGEVIELGPVYK
jgi:NAD(P)-dependent dehydrogenase (short-subunit alcohol dehydrogenase family)